MRNPPTEPVRTLYLVNDLVKTIIQNTDYSRIRLVTAGVKVFGKAEGQKGASGATLPTLRVLSDGLQTVLPYMQPDMLLVTDMAALRICLETYHPFVSQFSEPLRSALEQKGSQTISQDTNSKQIVSMYSIWKPYCVFQSEQHG